MTEKEHMLAGKLYIAATPELAAEYLRSRALCKKFNDTHPKKTKKRAKILKNLLGHIGDGAVIQAPFHCDYGSHISVGERSFINYNCVILDVNRVKIGRHVLIAPGVTVSAAGHPVCPEQRLRDEEFGLPVEIGDNVWIGAGALILPGVKIGENTVVGAGSVVNRDLPANCVCAGVPAKVIRPITQADALTFSRD